LPFLLCITHCSRCKPLVHISPLHRPLCRDLCLLDLQLFPTHTQTIFTHRQLKKIKKIYSNTITPLLALYFPIIFAIVFADPAQAARAAPQPLSHLHPLWDTSAALLPVTLSQLSVPVTPSWLGWGGQALRQQPASATNSWQGLRSLLRAAASCAAQGCWQGPELPLILFEKQGLPQRKQCSSTACLSHCHLPGLSGHPRVLLREQDRGFPNAV